MQNEHIDALIAISRRNSIMSEQIQSAYVDYLEKRSNIAFSELIHMLDDLCVSWVRAQLWKTGCYNDDNVDTILQNARLSVWETILKENEERNNFAQYAFGIYKKKTFDIIRKTIRRKNNMNVVSIDEPVGDSGKSLIDVLTFEQPNAFEQNDILKIYNNVFKIYCTAFMDSNAFPPRILALVYARVLPHILEKIPYSKATSAKWAFDRMDVHSVGKLGVDSEKTLQTNVDRKLHWGDPFIIQLNDRIEISGKSMILKDVIYTDNYNKAKIEDWADSMHKTAVTGAKKLLIKNKNLLELIQEYFPDDRILSQFYRENRGETR